MAQQDDYFYEIQLSNKQLVFYFMAGATVLIVSFLVGVMVGRGVDANTDVQAARNTTAPVEEKAVVEEPPRPAPPAAEDLTYAQRLESDKGEEGLEKPVRTAAAAQVKPPAPAAAEPPPVVTPQSNVAREIPRVAPTPAAVATARPTPRAAVPTPAPRPAVAAAAPAKGQFTIQVGAFKDRASADTVSGQLKGKGFAAYVLPPASPDGLFNVRVGAYSARPDAERVQVRLRDQEKFKPFIVKN
ncbi:MAG: SPOR domain-containing protein [Vicinamibacteria bacterium]